MTQRDAQNPLRAVLAIRREEWPFAWRMFGYFFLVITTFWILKPIKKSLFIEYYDRAAFELAGFEFNAARAELLAKVLNMGVAFVAVVVFSALSTRLQRERLSHVFSVFFGAAFVLYSFLLVEPSAAAVWSFYLLGDLYSTLMVATFFSFLSDSLSPQDAKRLYGLVVLGGVTGGVFGTTALRQLIDQVPTRGWLWACLATAAAIALLAQGAGKRVPDAPDAAVDESDDEAPDEGIRAALDGARLALRSRYLLSIVAIVGLYEVVSTVMDFQFTATVAHYLDGDAIGRHVVTVYMITNITSLVVQVFVTGAVMRRFGILVALLVLPAMALTSSTAFLVVPALWVGSALNTADNAFSYSINQSAKEALYTLTTRREKYRAKAFIDMFLQRFAKVLAVGVTLAITAVVQSFAGVRWLSLVTVLLGALWVLAVRYAGGRFDENTQAPPST